MALTDQQKRNLAKAAATLAASGATALAVMLSITKPSEGIRTTAYRDIAGVWTICIGETEINARPVMQGDRVTEAFCVAQFNRRAQFFLDSARAGLIKQPPPLRMGALGDFCYNIGVAACTRSSTFHLINAGHVFEGCGAMMAWNKARVWNPATHQRELREVGGLTTRRWIDRLFCQWELPR